MPPSLSVGPGGRPLGIEPQLCPVRPMWVLGQEWIYLLSQREEALGAGEGGKGGGLGTWWLETWVVTTCWRNMPAGRGGASLAIILRDVKRLSQGFSP